MSRTKKDRKDHKRYRVIKNALIKKILECYSDEIVGRKKDRALSRKMRSRLKRLSNKEIIGDDK
jgi:hypothetical protein